MIPSFVTTQDLRAGRNVCLAILGHWLKRRCIVLLSESSALKISEAAVRRRAGICFGFAF